MRQVTGKDVRMKDFRRSVLRGYAVGDVDDFLMNVAVALDRRDRIGPMHLRVDGDDGTGEPDPGNAEHRPPAHARVDDTPPSAPAATEPPRHTAAQHVASPAHAPIPSPPPVVAAGRAHHAADADADAEAILAAARAQAADILAHSRASAETTLNDARESARRGLAKARERAHELLADAAERRELAARAETAAQLKLTHVERMLDEKAALIAAEARRLDELAGRLAEHDLRPDLGVTDRPAHAVGDVVEFKR